MTALLNYLPLSVLSFTDGVLIALIVNFKSDVK